MCRMASASLVTAGLAGAPGLAVIPPEPPPPHAVSAMRAAATPIFRAMLTLVSAEDRVQAASRCGVGESVELSLFLDEFGGTHESTPGTPPPTPRPRSHAARPVPRFSPGSDRR